MVLTLSYNINSSLKEQLRELDALKLQILTANINPRTQTILAWESMLDRLYLSLDTVVSGNRVINSRERLARKLLSSVNSTKTTQAAHLSSEEKPEMALTEAYRDELYTIYIDWKASKEEITVSTVVGMYERLKESLSKDQRKDQTSLNSYEKSLERLLKYLQSGNDHPVVKSAVSFIFLGNMAPFGILSNKVNLLLSYLFLYKEGYDISRLLVIEEFLSNPSVLNSGVQNTLKIGNLNEWLEFYINSVTLSLETIKKRIAKETDSGLVDGQFWDLNDRQKKILRLFDEPGLSVTNRMVQARFEVSQITASRDLARLADMGLIAPHGKGRSVYYIKL